MTPVSQLGALVMALALAGSLHAQDAATPEPSAAPRRPTPFAAFSATAGEIRDSVVALARAQLGTRYVFGGTTPEKGFDCSGLIRYIAASLKLDVPRTADQQSRAGRAVAKDPDRLRPGDLLTFGTGPRVTHIGIYVGEGKYVHASTGAGKVIESRLDRPRWRGVKPWRGVRRLIADAGDDAPR